MYGAVDMSLVPNTCHLEELVIVLVTAVINVLWLVSKYMYSYDSDQYSTTIRGCRGRSGWVIEHWCSDGKHNSIDDV